MGLNLNSFNLRGFLLAVLICLSTFDVEAGRAKRDLTVTDPTTQTEYMIVTSERVNWTEALTACGKQRGWTLASVESTAEQEFLKSQVEGIDSAFSFWTSGTRDNPGQSWTWMSTGSSILQSLWGDGEPNDVPFDCTGLFVIRGWLLASFICNDGRNYICKRQKEEVKPCPTPTTEIPTTTKYYQ